VRMLSSVAMPASNATVSKLYGNRRGILSRPSQDVLSRGCSMLIDFNRVAHGVPGLIWSLWSVSFIWFI
jgi:hypothetical protein